jgi:XTP/dITP diphosphohydrolase
LKLVVATRNAGKLIEYRRMLQAVGFQALSLMDAGFGPEVELPEVSDTFEGNARSKAAALHQLTGGWALGDDSGLEVDALQGAPGVYSARYAGMNGPAAKRDMANLEKLLAEIEHVPDAQRTARFVCFIALAGPGGQWITARGTCEGRIVRVPRGDGGFGYDPVFLPEGHLQTMAELSLDEKNKISHRGRALEDLVRKIEKSVPSING